MAEYSLHGPFEIPKTGERKVDRNRLKEFWQRANKDADGLSGASGCYIFGMRAGRGAKPWYIGQAKTSFKGECFADQKREHYNSVLGKRKGTPILFLLARRTPEKRIFQKKLKPDEANRLENLLIALGLRANSDLCNRSGTAFMKETTIPGLLNKPRGKLAEKAKFLRRFLNL